MPRRKNKRGYVDPGDMKQAEKLFMHIKDPAERSIQFAKFLEHEDTKENEKMETYTRD